MNKAFIILLVLFVGVHPPVYSQQNFTPVTKFLQDKIADLGGRAVLMIYKDGQVIYSHAENEVSKRQKRIARFIEKRRGLEAQDRSEDYTVSSKERIASSSKWLSAALVMTFVDEGKLNLEDSIGKFLPVMSMNGKGNIRIWQCLSHLTGIKSAGLKESLTEMKNISSMDEAMDKIALLPMEGEPGKTFHYSNTGLQIAGAVIEKINGKSFEELFIERIAKPCEMNQSDFGNGKVALPAGGAYSTPEDYMHFLSMILNNGLYKRKKILSERSVVLMQQNYAKDAVIKYSPAEAGNWGYGFGEWVMEDAALRSKAVTSPGLFGAFPWVDNDRGYAAFLFCFNLKSKGRGEMYHQLKDLVDAGLR